MAHPAREEFLAWVREVILYVQRFDVTIEDIEKLLGEVTPTTPPDTGTTLPGPRARFWRRGLGRVVG